MSPVYDYQCEKCGEVVEVCRPMGSEPPDCCGVGMKRKYSADTIIIKTGAPLWTGRMDDIHKAQEQRGERLRFVHPKEIRAT